MSTQTQSATSASAVTPADTGATAPNASGFDVRGLYVGVGGDVTCVLIGDTAAVTFKNVPTGTLLPIQVGRVNSTGTTATNMIVLR